MLDIKLIRQDAASVSKALKSRGIQADMDAVIALDEKHRAALRVLEAAQASQNAASKSVDAKDASRIAELKELKMRIKELQTNADDLETQLIGTIALLPNIPLADTPVGVDGGKNKEVSVFGDKPEFSFEPKHYMDIAVPLGMIDTEAAGVVSGSRFGYVKGGAARLQFALLQYALSRLTDERFIADLIQKLNLPIVAAPFVPVIPPVMVRPDMMRAMGFAERSGVPAGTDEIYWLDKDGLYLVGTSEQSLGPMHYDKILSTDEIPLRYAGYSTCFRRESGAAGKDTRGILRVHQFDKMEMFTVCAPEHSASELQLILGVAESLMQGLGLHYRVLQLCTGELGPASAATFDIETWMPGQNEYRETHSISTTTDYQARALKTRIRTDDGTVSPAHMLNGTVFSQRPMIAVLEHYQQEDGTVRVPDVLRPFMGGLDVIRG